MGKKIYVGNMSYGTTEEGLRTLFSAYGDVESVNVIMDHQTGRARGFGFVQMVTDEGADAAINALNGKEFDGRQLKVNEAFDRPRRENNRRF